MSGSLLGKCTILCGKDGTGKSTEVEKMLGSGSIILDWHGDYERKGFPGKKFSMMQVKEFIEYCARPEIRDRTIIFEEAENYFARERYNPFGIDRIKINWMGSAKGPHHQNNHLIFVYHSLTQIPDDIKHFYDYFFLYEQEGTPEKIKQYFAGDKFYDAYLYYQTIYNNPEQKIRIERNGTVELVKPPFIFKRTQEIPKIQIA